MSQLHDRLTLGLKHIAPKYI